MTTDIADIHDDIAQPYGGITPPADATVVYADGGYDPTQPYDNAATWLDDSTRTEYTVDLTDPDRPLTSTPYGVEQDGRADAAMEGPHDLDRLRHFRGRVSQASSLLDDITASLDALSARTITDADLPDIVMALSSVVDVVGSIADAYTDELRLRARDS